MRQSWVSTPQGFWLGPALLGVALIVAGVLIWAFPRLLEIFVGSVFVMAGMMMLGIAWRMRGQVTYRRVDEQGEGPDET